MLGGSLGLAVLAAVAAARTGSSLSSETLTAGYHLAFVVGAIFVVVAAIMAGTLLRAQRDAGEAVPQPS
jgi:hypothetical protein